MKKLFTIMSLFALLANITVIAKGDPAGLPDSGRKSGPKYASGDVGPVTETRRTPEKTPA